MEIMLNSEATRQTHRQVLREDCLMQKEDGKQRGENCNREIVFQGGIGKI